MRPLFHPTLVNEPFGDPSVYVDCLFEKRAILFDLGDIRALAPRKILRISDVFVSHTHMDHFMGFDWLLRICLGRERKMRLYGPPGFLAQVEHRLAAYTWNLVQRYDTDFTFDVTEIQPEGKAQRASFHCKAAFKREGKETLIISDGVLLDEETFRIRSVFLDHITPCLAFALEEKQHLNVWKNRLTNMGLPVGPWLQDLKRAVRREESDDSLFRVWWRKDGTEHEKFVLLGELKQNVLRIVPGQKIAYVTDAVYHEGNAARIVELAHNADVLFIEAPFLQEDAESADKKYHLTAHQAGILARRARAKVVVPFHFSPKYQDGGKELGEELMRAFGLQNE